MPLAEPGWWYPSDGRPPAIARALTPLGWIYGQLVMRRLASTTPYRAPVPVICIGNFTAGGTGKTPMARYLARLIRGIGRRPVILARGYGGRLSGPHWVEAGRDTADDVGDEPLLLARDTPVLIARDRAAGARTIVRDVGSDAVIIMDDGLQNPGLAKDLTIAVVDARRRFGNGRLFPAGPLRAPLAAQQQLVDAIVINRTAGETATAEVLKLSGRRGAIPHFLGETGPADDPGWISGRRLVAFAGIGNPDRFFGLLERLGATLVTAKAFADHAVIADRDAATLLQTAEAADAIIVTTEKDMARLSGRSGRLGELRDRARVLPVLVRFETQDGARLEALVRSTLAARDEGALA